MCGIEKKFLSRVNSDQLSNEWEDELKNVYNSLPSNLISKLFDALTGIYVPLVVPLYLLEVLDLYYIQKATTMIPFSFVNIDFDEESKETWIKYQTTESRELDSVIPKFFMAQYHWNNVKNAIEEYGVKLYVLHSCSVIATNIENFEKSHWYLIEQQKRSFIECWGSVVINNDIKLLHPQSKAFERILRVGTRQNVTY